MEDDIHEVFLRMLEMLSLKDAKLSSGHEDGIRLSSIGGRKRQNLPAATLSSMNRESLVNKDAFLRISSRLISSILITSSG